MLQAEITYATTAQHAKQHWSSSVHGCTVHLQGNTTCQHHVVFPCKCTVQPCTLLGQCCFACCAVVAYVISACSIKHNSANAPYLPWWAAHCNADADQHRVVFPCKCTVQPCTLLDQCCFACCAVVAYVISACSIKHNCARTPYLPSETAH